MDKKSSLFCLFMRDESGVHIQNSWVKIKKSQFMILGIIIICGAIYADSIDSVAGGVGDKPMGMAVIEWDLGD